MKFDKPFAAKKTADSVVAAGTGDALTAGQTITFDYLLVNGRTGKEIQTSYGQTPASLVLDASRPRSSSSTGLTGEKVGSRVLVAIAPKDGLAKQLNSSKVKKNDTLLFVIDVKSVRTPLAQATGEAVRAGRRAPDGRARRQRQADHHRAERRRRTHLARRPAADQGHRPGRGGGPDDQRPLHRRRSGTAASSSTRRGTAATPADFVIGKGQVIAGWDEGLVGQTVGSQVLLVVPPDKGYGAAGNTDAGIKGTDTLVFVVDILDAY